MESQVGEAELAGRLPAGSRMSFESSLTQRRYHQQKENDIDNQERLPFKLDQGALGMSDPSPVSHQQGDQAIRNTRFIRGHKKQRRICSASPAVHYLPCIT